MMHSLAIDSPCLCRCWLACDHHLARVLLEWPSVRPIIGQTDHQHRTNSDPRPEIPVDHHPKINPTTTSRLDATAAGPSSAVAPTSSAALDQDRPPSPSSAAAPSAPLTTPRRTSPHAGTAREGATRSRRRRRSPEEEEAIHAVSDTTPSARALRSAKRRRVKDGDMADEAMDSAAASLHSNESTHNLAGGIVYSGDGVVDDSDLVAANGVNGSTNGIDATDHASPGPSGPPTGLPWPGESDASREEVVRLMIAGLREIGYGCALLPHAIHEGLIRATGGRPRRSRWNRATRSTRSPRWPPFARPSSPAAGARSNGCSSVIRRS